MAKYKFVQIAVASAPSEEFEDGVYALNEKGGVFLYDWEAKKWRRLGEEETGDDVEEVE